MSFVIREDILSKAGLSRKNNKEIVQIQQNKGKIINMNQGFTFALLLVLQN